jgi:hypothetical protein
MAILSYGQVGWRSASVAPLGSLLLDTYSGASSAYSLRKLRTAYTGAAIRVRRSSDSTAQDIGFKADGSLDTTALLAFVGAGNGFVSIWYDQAGSANFTQPNSANQPQIVSSGSVLIDNGKPTISFGTQSNLWYLNSPATFLANTASPICMFNIWKITDWANSNGGVFGPTAGNSKGLEITQTSVISRRSLLRINNVVKNDNSSESYQLWNNAAQTLSSINMLSSSVSAYKNGTAISLTNTTGISQINNINDTYSIGVYSSTYPAYMNQQEMIFFITDKTSDRTGIESNINSFYSIY